MEVSGFLISFDQALASFQEAADELFDLDPRVRSIGITRRSDTYAYRVVRNSDIPAPFRASRELPDQLFNIPIDITDTPGDIESMLLLPDQPNLPIPFRTLSVVPEASSRRPLVCGLEIQNFDDDDRQGVVQQGYKIVGSIGCFVRLDDFMPAILSNNHVVAAEGRGITGSDRILQPGSSTFDVMSQAGILGNFIPLIPSPISARRQRRDRIYNDVDAGIPDTVQWTQGYLSHRNLPRPSGIAQPVFGDRVFKVGRTTGLTYGTISDTNTIVGPVPYTVGDCWFRNALTIDGDNGMLFSDKGDSGSAIIKTNGEVVGILFAGNGQQTYACPIDRVLQLLSCSIA